jgi:hypothetical protein
MPHRPGKVEKCSLASIFKQGRCMIGYADASFSTKLALWNAYKYLIVGT